MVHISDRIVTEPFTLRTLEMALGTAVFIIGIIWLMIASPGFRRLMLIGAGGLVLLTAALAVWTVAIQPSLYDASTERDHLRSCQREGAWCAKPSLYEPPQSGTTAVREWKELLGFKPDPAPEGTNK
jgi:hypothetical protein